MDVWSRADSTDGVLPRVSLGFPTLVPSNPSSAVDNEDHCDFRKLRSLLLRVHMLDLVSTTEETHYEAYRQTQMETRKFGEAKVKKLDNPKFKEEEELLRKRFTEQVKLEEARFRQWEQHVSVRPDERGSMLTPVNSSLPNGTG
jgi:cell division control protein 12